MEKNVIEKYELINGQAIIDMNYTVISANEEMYRFFGISTNISFMETIHQVDLDDFIDVCHHLRDSQESDMIVRMRRADNSYRWILLHIARFRLRVLNTTMDYYEVSAADIIALKKRYQALETMIKASNKPRVLLHEDLMYTREEALDYCREIINSDEPEKDFTLLLVEIDGMDQIVSQGSEAFAQIVLNTAIDTTKSMLDGRGIVCAHEDRTFSVVVRDINQEINLRSFAEALRNRISWNELIQNNIEQLTLSIGISRYPQNGENFDIVVKKLYRALDICHTRGVSKYIIYREHLHGEIR
jgi:GGDEF domain-containing protein